MNIRWTLPNCPTKTDLAALASMLAVINPQLLVIHDHQHFEAASEIMAYVGANQEDLVVASNPLAACVNTMISPSFPGGRFAYWQADVKGLPIAVFYRSSRDFVGIVRLFPEFSTRFGAKELLAMSHIDSPSPVDFNCGCAEEDLDPNADLVGVGA